jgi:hypothetical protein
VDRRRALAFLAFSLTQADRSSIQDVIEDGPVKVDAATDRLISDAAHFLGRTKKDIVSDAVREYVETHRDELTGAIK